MARTQRQWRSLLAVAIVATGLLVGCGDGGDDRAPGLAPKFAAITSQLQRDTDALRTLDEDGETNALIVAMRVYRGLLEASEKAKAAYDDLDVPGDMERSHERLIDALEKRITILRRLIRAGETGDQATVGQAVREVTSNTQPIAAAQAAIANEIAACAAKCR